jgi:hypothetical protein
LGVVKLNNRSLDTCMVTGPIKINGVNYSSFGPYPNGGPELPLTGGKLNVSYTLMNFGNAALATRAQPVIYLDRRDNPSLMHARSLKPLTPKSYTVPAKGTVNVSLTVSVPGALMAATPPEYSYLPWAFNVGFQFVNTNSVANCWPILFPVIHKPAPTSAMFDDNAPETITLKPRTIPLTLDKHGKALEYGPMPKTP